MYYKDLTPYTYGRRNYGDNHVNIGWLEDEDYPKGDVPNGFLNKLKGKVVGRYKGFHICPFCKEKGKTYYRDSSVDYVIKGNDKYYHYPGLLGHYISEHGYKPPQEFIDVVMGINEANAGDGAYLPVLGPATDFDMFYNARVVGNILQSSPDTIKGLKTELIDDDYFKNNLKKKKVKKPKKKIKRFKEYTKEGAGFGNVDYRNVTGQATTSGYLNDKQPMGNSASSTIASDIPRGNWLEPSTVLVGFKDYLLEDPYFLKRQRRKNRRKKDFKDRERDTKSKKINNKYKKEVVEEKKNKF